MKNQTHKKRILTATVVLPIVIWIVLKAPFFIFCSFVFLVGILASLEFGRLWHLHNSTTLNVSHLFLNLLILIGFALYAPLSGIILAFFLMAFYFVWAYGHQPELTSFLPAISLGLFYPNVLLGHVFPFITLPQGRLLLLWTLFMTFAVDTGAFYTGRKFGKHKLYPAVSPKKSWEGLIGGITSALILGGISAIWLPVGFFKILGLSFILAIVSQIGDFFESMLKRQAGVKDSGWLLPGHGGILDRIDGVLFALPLSYYCWQWWIK